MSNSLSEISHNIPLEKAREMISLYRKEMDKILKPELTGKDILPHSETFKKDAIQRLLDQTDCTALRIYYSMDPEKKLHAILVGVNQNNQDIVPGSLDVLNPSIISNPPVQTAEILEESVRCPPDCPTTGTP